MEEGPHAHAHAPHGTGLRWLDISLAVSAFVVSIASLWLTIHNARTMEHPVASNSYPNLDFEVGNLLDLHDGPGTRAVVHLDLQNTGIGPARLRTLEIGYGERLASNLRALPELCCGAAAGAAQPRGYCAAAICAAP